MKKYIFNTNINCAGCEKRVRPSLDELPQVKQWSVDTSQAHKPLSIWGEDMQAVEAVVAALEDLGFEAQLSHEEDQPS